MGLLSYRPAYHLTDIPLAIHIGVKGDSGNIEYMNPEHVWCEVSYKNDVDYQTLANERGMINGKFVPKKVYEALYDYRVDIRNDKNYKAA